MLGDPDAGGRSNESRCGGDIEQRRTVAAGTDDIGQPIAIDVDPVGPARA